jgi:sterol desaturase/sphingolipid hydroxylase (fatty acid hydroxylase superfamily)
MNPILYAIPVFMAMIALEALWAHVKFSNRVADAGGLTRPVYQLADAIASLNIGILSRIAAAFPRLLTLGLYILVFQKYSLGPWNMNNPLAWVVALVMYDFLYYWKHRANHEVRIMWAGHITHHNSEFFNLSTALRQSSTTFLFDWIFYLPMAILGIPPAMFVLVALIDLLYQFWVHTELIGKLGWFDRIFVSPSNHRVHHGQDDYCLDKNYGGILIIWDRLFGTYEDERDEPIVYGVRTQLASVNPLWGNWHYYAIIWNDFLTAKGLAAKLDALIAPPVGWEGDKAEPFHPQHFQRYELNLERRVIWYALAQLVLNVLAISIFTFYFPKWEIWQSMIAAIWIVASLVAVTGWMEKRRWAAWLEVARWSVAPAIYWLLFL